MEWLSEVLSFFLKGIVLNWLENLSSQFHEVLINTQWCNQKFSKGGAVLNLSPKDFYFASGKLLFIQSFFFLMKFDDWGGFTRSLSLHWAITCTSRLHTIYLENFYAIASNLSINNYNKRSRRFSIACVTKLSIHSSLHSYVISYVYSLQSTSNTSNE